MKASRTLLLLLLTATSIGGVWLAWRQYAELVELRAIAMNREERAELQKRLWDLEKLNRELQDKLAGVRPAGNALGPRLAAANGANPSRDSDARGGRGDPRGRGESGLQQMNAMRELLAKPDVQAMISLQQKAGIESRYAALFKNLNVSPDQAARLNALLVERGTTSMDVFNAAREQGIDPRTNPEALRQLLSDAQNEVNNGIKSVIGESGFAQLQTYEQTLAQRSLVNELQQRLSYTSTPLTPAQSEQLIQILATNTPPRSPSPGASPPGSAPSSPPARGPGFGSPGGGRGSEVGGMMMGFVGGGGGAAMIPEILDSAARVGGTPVTNAAIAQAQTVLAPPQVSALQQIQQQQQAQQQLQQIFRDTVMPTPPTPGPGTPTADKRRPGPG